MNCHGLRVSIFGRMLVMGRNRDEYATPLPSVWVEYRLMGWKPVPPVPA